MKRLLTVIMFLTIGMNLSAQLTEEPIAYTLKEAGKLADNGDYQKAIWIYINLFPVHEDEVVEMVMDIANKLDTVDMARYIRSSFGTYSLKDPEIITYGKNGMPKLNMEKLSLKGSWGDKLISEVLEITGGEMQTPRQYNFRGLKKAAKDKHEQAILDFDSAINIMPVGAYFFNRGFSKAKLEDYNEAILDFDTAIAMNVIHVESYFERGYCKFKIEDYQGALVDYSAALELEKAPKIYNNRAYTKVQMKDYAGAIKDFDEALKIVPKYSEALTYRGYAKLKMGKLKAGCKDWKKAESFGSEQATRFIIQYCE